MVPPGLADRNPEAIPPQRPLRPDAPASTLRNGGHGNRGATGPLRGARQRRASRVAVAPHHRGDHRARDRAHCGPRRAGRLDRQRRALPRVGGAHRRGLRVGRATLGPAGRPRPLHARSRQQHLALAGVQPPLPGREPDLDPRFGWCARRRWRQAVLGVGRYEPPRRVGPHARSGGASRSRAGDARDRHRAAAAGTPGWHPDPWRQHQLRWWDGVQWTGYTWPPDTAGGSS